MESNVFVKWIKAMRTFLQFHPWTILFSIISLEGFWILWLFVRVPSELKSTFILGLSAQRLISILISLLLILFWVVLAYLNLKHIGWPGKLSERLQDQSRQRKFAAVISGLFFASAVLTFLPSDGQPFIAPGYYERLRPLIQWLALSFLEILIFLAISSKKYWLTNFFAETRRQRPGLYAAFLALGSFMLLWLVILITGIGVNPDDRFWNEAGVPVIGLQIFVSLAISLAFGLIFFARRKISPTFFSGWRLDLIVCVLLWAVAAWFWTQTPMPRSYFAPGPYSPNQVYYPYSDAEIYDRGAQYVFIGQGLNNHQYIDKPFYMLMLTFFHLAVGQEYLPVVQLQAVFLAIFPALLFLLGKNLYNRTAGLLAGIFLIFQQTNAIAATLQIQVSHSRLMMTEFPTAFGIALLALVVIRWLKHPVPTRLSVFLTGGILGILLLIRTNTLFLAPFILLVFILTFGRMWRKWVMASFLFLLGILLVIGPWFFFNRDSSGRSFIDVKVQAVFSQRYDDVVPLATNLDLNGNPIPTIAPAATISPGQTAGSGEPTVPATPIGEPTAPATASGSSPGLFSKMGDRIYKALQFVPNHFVHNLVTAALILPASVKSPSISFLDLDLQAPYWNNSWNGSLSLGSALILLVMLAILALGIGGAWNSSRLAGLVPLIFLVAYYLSNAFARTSGSRYLVPADWVILFYFALGMIQVCTWCGVFLRTNIEPPEEQPAALSQAEPRRGVWFRNLFLLAAGMLLVATSLLWIGNFFPVRYPPASSSELLQGVLGRGSLQAAGLSEAQLTSFLDDPNAIVLRGKGLYPRFYNSKQGEPSSHNTIFGVTGSPRLIIRLIGPLTTWVVLPIPGSPSTFEDNADITVVGCVKDMNVIAKIVVVENTPDQVYLNNPQTSWTCH